MNLDDPLYEGLKKMKWNESKYYLDQNNISYSESDDLIELASMHKSRIIEAEEKLQIVKAKKYLDERNIPYSESDDVVMLVEQSKKIIEAKKYLDERNIPYSKSDNVLKLIGSYMYINDFLSNNNVTRFGPKDIINSRKDDEDIIFKIEKRIKNIRAKNKKEEVERIIDEEIRQASYLISKKQQASKFEKELQESVEKRKKLEMEIKQSTSEWIPWYQERNQRDNYEDVKDAINYLCENNIPVKAKKIFQIIKAKREFNNFLDKNNITFRLNKDEEFNNFFNENDIKYTESADDEIKLKDYLYVFSKYHKCKISFTKDDDLVELIIIYRKALSYLNNYNISFSSSDDLVELMEQYEEAKNYLILNDISFTSSDFVRIKEQYEEAKNYLNENEISFTKDDDYVELMEKHREEVLAKNYLNENEISFTKDDDLVELMKEHEKKVQEEINRLENKVNEDKRSLFEKQRDKNEL